MIVDDSVFRVESELDGWNERPMVFRDDPQAAAQARVRAAPRLQRVLCDRREVSEREWQASGLDLAAAANSDRVRLAQPIDLTNHRHPITRHLLTQARDTWAIRRARKTAPVFTWIRTRSSARPPRRRSLFGQNCRREVAVPEWPGEADSRPFI